MHPQINISKEKIPNQHSYLINHDQTRIEYISHMFISARLVLKNKIKS